MALGMIGSSSSEDEEKKKAEGRSQIGQWLEQKNKQMNQAADIPDNAGRAYQSTPAEKRTPYNASPQARQANAAQLKGLGVNTSNAYVAGKPKSDELNNYPKVFAGKQSDLAPQTTVKPIAESYLQDSHPQKLGFNPAGQSGSLPADPAQNLGFRMPNAPRLSWSERNDRENLLAKISTPNKGAQNGQLTAKQMELMADIGGRDQKYANDQYGTQVSAASQLAQTAMTQDGANTRATQGEDGTNDRLNTQLGFDAAKFQQTAQQQQQVTNNDTRRLDMQQSNDDVQNFAPKQLNSLYAKYEAANGEWEKSDLAKQIQALKGTTSSDKYVAIDGGETLSTDGLTAVKNPAVLLNTRDGSTKQQSKGERSFSDPKMLALQNRTDISMEEKERLANLYLDGGDI